VVKIILLVLGGLLVYWILKSYRRNIQRNASKPNEALPEDMVRCAQCGVNLPRSEGMLSQGKFFCSDDHRQLHQK